MKQLIDLLLDAINSRWSGDVRIKFYYGGVTEITKSEPVPVIADPREVHTIN